MSDVLNHQQQHSMFHSGGGGVRLLGGGGPKTKGCGHEFISFENKSKHSAPQAVGLISNLFRCSSESWSSQYYSYYLNRGEKKGNSRFDWTLRLEVRHRRRRFVKKGVVSVNGLELP